MTLVLKSWLHRDFSECYFTPSDDVSIKDHPFPSLGNGLLPLLSQQVLKNYRNTCPLHIQAFVSATTRAAAWWYISAQSSMPKPSSARQTPLPSWDQSLVGSHHHKHRQGATTLCAGLYYDCLGAWTSKLSSSPHDGTQLTVPNTLSLSRNSKQFFEVSILIIYSWGAMGKKTSNKVFPHSPGCSKSSEY